MRRRQLLVASAAAIPAATGCLEAFGDEGDEGDDPEGSGGEAASTVDISLEHPEYVVTTASTYSTELNNADPVEEFDESVREYVREAVEEGTVEVDEPDDALLDAVQGVRYVRDGDEVYAFDHRLPEYVVTGEVADIDGDEVNDDRVVSMSDDIVRALGPDNRQIISMANSVVETDGRRNFVGAGEYRTPSLTDELEEFLDETDYLGVPTGDDPTAIDEYVELELSRDEAEEPYRLTAERLTREELFEVDEVRDIGTLSEEVAEVVRTAVEDEYRGDTLPDGFEDEVGDAYFFVDDEAHRPELLEPDYAGIPMELEVDVPDDRIGVIDEPLDEDDLEEYQDRFEDAHESDDEDEIDALIDELWDEYRPDDGARFELSVNNTSDETVTVFSGAPAPFGVLYAEDADNDDRRRRRLVWSESYVDDGHVNVGPRGLSVNAIGLNTDFEAGETEAETYEVGFPSGEYRVEESLSVSRGRRGEDEESWTYPYTVVIDVGREDDDEA